MFEVDPTAKNINCSCFRYWGLSSATQLSEGWENVTKNDGSVSAIYTNSAQTYQFKAIIIYYFL